MFSNRRHDTIFKIGEYEGRAMATQDVADIAKVAHASSQDYAEKMCWPDADISAFEQQVYAAGFVSGYKKAR